MRFYLLVFLSLMVIVFGLSAENLTINEIYYTTRNNGNETQWLELYNSSTQNVDIGGWKIGTSMNPGSAFLIPAGTVINSKDFLVFASSMDVMASLWGLTENVVEYGNKLTFSQTGEDIHLFNATNNEIDVIWYGDGDEMGSSNAANTVSFGSSLARNPDGRDTDNPSRDLTGRFPTPGQSNNFTGFSQGTWGKIKAIYSIKRKLFGA